MKTNIRVLTFAGFFAATLFSATTYSDDTEIFFNIDEASLKPNLLFVIDNSGSMDANVTTWSQFDSSVSYSGPLSDDYIYINQGGWRNATDLSRESYYHGFPKSAVKCESVFELLDSSGRAVEYEMASWRTTGWLFKSTGWKDVDPSDNDASNYLECKDDRGIHGATSGTSQSYARNHSDQWGTEDQEIDWGRISKKDFYSANYGNWYLNHRKETTQTRMEIVKGVAKSLAGSMSGVNIGLMAFNTDGEQRQGGRVLVPIQDIATGRETFRSAVEALEPKTWTPLAETLFGAMRYFAGDSPFLDSNPVTGTVSGGNYNSPVEYECQSNNVVVLTDGEPTYDGYDEGGRFHAEDQATRVAMESVVGSCSGNCLDEIAQYMHEEDISSTIEGNVHVQTYTIGFDLDLALLADAARKGDGEYYLANDADSLEKAFTEIMREVLAVNTTYVAPGVAVNSFNRLNHLDALYFSVFTPEVGPRWDGNLKRYRLGPDGKIYDVDGNEAIDSATGFFKNSARSWWSDAPDGPKVTEGGAASQIPDNIANRKVYTYYSGSPSKDLTNSANALAVANKASLTKELFGDTGMTDAEHERLINWTRGADVLDEDKDGSFSDSRENYMADPLHSAPRLVVYGGSESEPDTAVFFGDNQGFLHGIDGSTGQAYFSFMPAELLPNQQRLFDNDKSYSGHIYGMDGSIISWIQDENANGKIEDGDKVYLYTGMRRGGRSYYGLDVTERTAPQVLWQIAGGAGEFEELGQSWSRPVKTRVNIGGTPRDVVIFSGGYDPQQDTVSSRTEDSMGRALYIVDANTGERIWWAGPGGSGADLELADMNFSIPSAPKAIDINGDGFTNQMYVGDMGGQIWRFDIKNGSALNDLITGGVIADLGGDTADSNRRFYHAPDLFGLNTSSPRSLGLAIGSGWQAHPLDKIVEDRIYMLKVPGVGNPPMNDAGIVDYDLIKITEADLYDTTANLIGEGDDDQRVAAQAELSKASGWFIRLDRAGEKILSSSQTASGQMFISSFEPIPSTDPCLPSSGTSRLYHINVSDGTPVFNYDGVGETDELTAPDREVEMRTPGIPPPPQRLRIDGEDVICVGAQCFPVENVSGMVETFWYEE